MNVIVRYDEVYDRWLVQMPEHPRNVAWSAHETKFAAELAAQEAADDMGYDGVEVRQ